MLTQEINKQFEEIHEKIHEIQRNLMCAECALEFLKSHDCSNFVDGCEIDPQLRRDWWGDMISSALDNLKEGQRLHDEEV
jgi:hypothetical protein